MRYRETRSVSLSFFLCARGLPREFTLSSDEVTDITYRGNYISFADPPTCNTMVSINVSTTVSLPLMRTGLNKRSFHLTLWYVV